ELKYRHCDMLVLTCTRLHFFFFFNDTPTPEIYTLSLHDALPIYRRRGRRHSPWSSLATASKIGLDATTHPIDVIKAQLIMKWHADRKSTRLNSSHVKISYAVFCLKKKKIIINT